MIPTRRRNASAFTRLLALTAAVAVPATFSITAETASAQLLAAELLPTAALPAAIAASDHATLRLAADAVPETLTGDETSYADADADDTQAAPTRAAALGEALTCMAKVVFHEARNQPRQGQLAVAQLIMARLASGRFADSVCGVVNQPGQFFNTASYTPDRSGEAWATAVAVSREALEGAAAAVAPGALFYHAAYAAPTGFFRTRQRIAMLGDHVFYR